MTISSQYAAASAMMRFPATAGQRTAEATLDRACADGEPDGHDRRRSKRDAGLERAEAPYVLHEQRAAEQEDREPGEERQQRDVDDEEVELRHERDRSQHRHDRPAATAVLRRGVTGRSRGGLRPRNRRAPPVHVARLDRDPSHETFRNWAS
ncbi:hypothetical protein [Actinoallomurus bryophytorum]|uniref:hypothetical protein n=1 Tax=Actinoallomurus bryophytorum TaxID=1490222 RepID=UPI00114FD0BF|nr:hypothetical protein [Actinoallomurus bryophytorum]